MLINENYSFKGTGNSISTNISTKGKLHGHVAEVNPNIVRVSFTRLLVSLMEQRTCGESPRHFSLATGSLQIDDRESD
jgi:hypothetical protein